ncbi:MAG: hypothetical protein AAB490_03715, partial [Patescibacteria group bacterium]
ASTDFSDPDCLYDSDRDAFDGWQGTALTFTSGSIAFHGTVALSLQGAGRISTNVITGILADKTFVLSWMGKASINPGSKCTADISIASQSLAAQTTSVDYTDQWTQYQLKTSFAVTNLDTQLIVSFSNDCLDAVNAQHDLFFDGVKYEINQISSGFTQYGTSGFVYGLSKFQCTKEDVGCDVYLPVLGGPSIPGKIDSDDACPSECVGYQSFLEPAGYFDTLEAVPLPPPPPRSVDFIPDTADECPATQVGCEEFTNLEEVAQGGEGIYYFSDIRQCVEDALGITYYTLEGSDTAGYQVRTWRVLESNIIDPVTNTGRAPCTNVDVSGTNCIDDLINTVSTYCDASQLQTNLDCREFFDLAGNPHYVLESRVIAASADCQAFRRSETGTNFFILGAESRQCAPEYKNCRAYRGNQGNNLRVMFNDTFESGTVTPWDPSLSSVSSEAATTGGHSLANADPSGTLQDFILRFDGKFDVPAGRDVYVEFWMKNTDAVRVWPGVIDPGPPVVGNPFQPIEVAGPSDWQLYRFGPLFINKDITGGWLRLNFVDPMGGGTPRVFVDNVRMSVAVTNVFRIKDSWVTPASCDTPVPGAMLGCQTYTDRSNTKYDLKSFSRLCSDDVIGCQAFIDTSNSTNPFQQIFNEDDPSEVIVSEDKITYFVFQEENLCFEQNKGCSALGLPNLNLDLPEIHPKYIDGYTVQALINDPDTYGTTLCTHDGLFCEEYTTSQGGNVYFKNPLDRTCIFKENVNIFGSVYTGWFQQKSLEQGQTPLGCSDDGLLPFESSDFELRENTAYNYDSWVGQCPQQYAGCTEFKDPTDTQGQNFISDPTFTLGISPTGPWYVNKGWGNALATINTGSSNDLAATNPAGNFATSRVSPKGFTALPNDNIYTLDQNAMYVVSAEVNIQKSFDDPNPKPVEARLVCSWDAPSDVDYCHRFGIDVDYTRTCTTDLDCVVPYTCGEKVALQYCENIATGEETNTMCFTDADCDNFFGAAAGYTCEKQTVPFQTMNTEYSDRDQAVVYRAAADMNIIGQWQPLSTLADVGTDGQGKELRLCTFAMRQEWSVYDPTVPSCLVADPAQPSCRVSYCVDANGSAGTNPTQCVTIADCNAGYPNCGGMGEVLWQNPSVAEARGYSYIDNEQIDSASCSGQVSKSEGCLLFLNTNDRANKLYNAPQTYAVGLANSGAPVAPVVCTPGDPACQHDSNRIIQVEKDRQCVEWLSCRSATEVFDPTTNSYRSLCDQVGICDERTSGTDALSCSHWVIPSPQRLEYGYYTSRSFDVNAVDYSGLSVYNLYEIGSLTLVDVSNVRDRDVNQPSGPDITHPDYRLVRVIDVCDSAIAIGQNLYGVPGTCGPTDPLDPSLKLGACFVPNKCVVGIDGSRFGKKSDFVITQSTRAYAEKDSPFPHSIIESDTGDTREFKFGFQSANPCENKTQSCESRYFKFRYGTQAGTVVKN